MSCTPGTRSRARPRRPWRTNGGTYQGWDVACVVRQLDDPAGGQRLLDAAGELIDKAVGTLKGKAFPGYRPMRFKGVSPAPGHIQPRTGTGIYVTSFELTLPIT